MKKAMIVCILCVVTGLTTPMIGQETVSITYTNTSDYHQGVLLGYEELLSKHFFFSYALGVSESHYFRWEYVANFDVGYRLNFNRYQPDIRLGFGYLFGNYKPRVLDVNKELIDPDQIDVHLTACLKLRWLNWNFKKSDQSPFRLMSSISVEYQYPENGGYNSNVNDYWHLIFEVGLGYQFYRKNLN